MSKTWSGFSEEDIKKLKSGNELSDGKTIGERKILKVKRKDPQNNTKSSNKNLVLKSASVLYEISETAKLSTNNDENTKTTNGSDTDNINSNIKQDGEIKDKVDITIVSHEHLSVNNSVIMDLSKIEKRVIDLDEFQARQKLIEEQNRKRKELLAKALADRTKRTEEEARKLKEIQNEFKKLDAILSNDVSILRHQIETASLEFMEAQKKYHRIEKEFLEAKLNLHQKLERKEMLTEHLCAIIEKNEERKAEKLSELINRLEVDTKIAESSISNDETEKTMEEKDDRLIHEVKNRREIKRDLNLTDVITDTEKINDNNGTNQS